MNCIASKIKVSIIIVIVLSIFTKNVYSFGWITHFHINRDADTNLGLIYETYGIMPDIYNTSTDTFKNFYTLEDIPVARVLHSSDGKEVPFDSGMCPYQNKQNFAYLTLKSADSNNKILAAKGMGAHIAADWVAFRQ